MLYITQYIVPCALYVVRPYGVRCMLCSVYTMCIGEMLLAMFFNSAASCLAGRVRGRKANLKAAQSLPNAATKIEGKFEGKNQAGRKGQGQRDERQT